MKRIHKVLLILLTITLVLPSFLVTAASTEGMISTKDEVVYATLSANGKQQDLYVVNTLDIEKAGKIIDYGSYSAIKNLTDFSEILQKESTIEMEAPEGKFYYQGSIDEKALPWNIDVSYILDGKEMAAKELVGQDGKIEIRINTSANKEVNPVFFTNYLLQISLTLDPALYTNIEAEKGMLANAGKNKQVTFTVMPEKEEEFVLQADVVDFELDGINITGVPSSMSIDAPEINEMTEDMSSLTDGIKQLHDGVGELKNGVSKLNSGVLELQNGSVQYNKGMTDISRASSGLVNGSNEIGKALEQISKSLNAGTEDVNLGDLEKLTAGLQQISLSLQGTVSEIAKLKEGYASAYGALDKAIAAIPAATITQEQIQELQKSGANQEVVNQLLNTYTAAQTAKGTYSQVKDGFTAVDGALAGLMTGLTEVATNLDTLATEVSASLKASGATESLAQLQQGLAALSANYQTFHSGLVEYTGGVGQLSKSYQKMHQGIVKLSRGTGELDSGVGELHNGTRELYESTSDLPEQMKEEVDRMISEYDKSDFEAVSFVSEQNKNVNLVQFVIKTESIKIEEPKTKEIEEKEVKGFWAKLLDLFK
ncbi:hypothetical protein [Fredinandcohnia onubensis]|uniref:hypothetical protein n=1 Tax=Fredinandcohnia onubensis TaxID=1571209 RepID=UPI000C0BC987|nr:hypothetical protein [Fredinandcohnia onubensis]